MHSGSAEVREVLGRINRAWLERRPDDLEQLLHPDMVAVFPGFAGRMQGRAGIVSGFVEFCENATVHAFEEKDPVVDVIDSTAVASYLFDMIYEREGKRFHSTGRDVWIFAREDAKWLAVWRTMLDISDEPMEA